ncbi:tryptophan 2,3-dioxygenase [Candidatus Marinimicrobia bacterium]|jgi:tryptophan 2,3-dioxygenase|nr:tryptophan 2,3-dioxygenase [Candidatus Neomarinimicrobiota bacterium]|tara:strand:+ start:137 stop:1246 length:1110 start_codon:yes stop_codon:yes gene_type:complete
MAKKKSSKSQYYKDYLRLSKILDSQNLISDEFNQHAHDEMLFIITHQVYELWFKQIIYELDSILDIFEVQNIDESNIGTSISRLNRIIEIQKILVDQIRVLETMTPMDFLDFRDFLVPASGFQSVQFRKIENKLGLLSKNRFSYGGANYKSYLDKLDNKEVTGSESGNTLFVLIEKWLERTPFLNWGKTSFWNEYELAVKKMLSDDRAIIETNNKLSEDEKKKHLNEYKKTELSFGVVLNEKEHSKMVNNGSWRLSYKATQAALLILLYRDQPILHNPYLLITKLADVDELFTTWRYRHVLMVSRMIGKKIGTGGSTGSTYLSETAQKHRVFSDLSELTTFLIPRSALPKLPREIKDKLNFYFHVKKEQ